jgi:hypothetical protein
VSIPAGYADARHAVTGDTELIRLIRSGIGGCHEDTSETLYLPLSIATSVTGGLLAGTLFSRVGKRLHGEEPAPPDPKDLSRSSSAVLLAGGRGLCLGL